MATSISPLVVFVARESAATGSTRAEFTEWLLESLQYVSSQHAASYDTIGWQLPKFFAFIHGANEPWCPRARHTTWMLDLVTEAKSLDCPVIIVLSGWSGLTTCPLVFDKIFGWFEDAGVPVKVRVFADRPRRFFDVNPQQVRGVLRGDITPSEDGVELEDSTPLYIDNFWLLHFARVKMSEAQQMMCDLDYHRNSHPNWIREFKSVCGICGERFRTQLLLAAHQGHKHPETRTKDFIKPEFKCPHCGGTFTRLDGLTRHKRGCKKNPQAERKERKKNARRGTRVNPNRLNVQPKGSDNSMKSYLTLTEEDAPLLPRLELSSPVVFRGELHCRYPGCRVTTRYHMPSALRLHYKAIHNFEYPGFKTTIGEEGRIQHEAGTAWLARCVQLGQENAGPAPPAPSVW
ncbi:hypothetical protein N7471_004700 [Penicillium samsonianum]|uniref:uncharacterized protein n=1 Tax=Penicillium samsonianum TaxID=1882272 RepID=UPI0025484182|nr:uncharacterized protein N7471_004700 [Penicillium samsonianum]KAJ6138214.1 hypothetical protein N7471_004700 [Penicillium samsonianum]